jgi:hypothetical protein
LAQVTLKNYEEGSDMAMNQALLGEFDHEMASTRKSLERVPDGKFDWKPHTKSMTMGALAAHIAFIPHWAKLTLDTPNFEVNPPGGQQARPPELKTKADVLASSIRMSLKPAPQSQPPVTSP